MQQPGLLLGRNVCWCKQWLLWQQSRWWLLDCHWLALRITAALKVSMRDWLLWSLLLMMGRALLSGCARAPRICDWIGWAAAGRALAGPLSPAG